MSESKENSEERNCVSIRKQRRNTRKKLTRRRKKTNSVSRNRRTRCDTRWSHDVYDKIPVSSRETRTAIGRLYTYLNELYRDRRFPDTTATDDDELVSLRVALSVRGLRHLPSRLGWIYRSLCMRVPLALAPHARLNHHLARTRVVTDARR